MKQFKIYYVNPTYLFYVYLRIRLFVEWAFKFVENTFIKLKEVLGK
ncbi:hypothetical protein JPSP18_26540 [Staphylococcus pseudintermedius]